MKKQRCYCAGAIGYRSLRQTELKNSQQMALMEVGASAESVLKMVKIQFSGTPVFVFARNEKEQHFVLALGAAWAGVISEVAPENRHAMINTVLALKPAIESSKNFRLNHFPGSKSRRQVFSPL